ncbi:high-affinity methionine permease [Colletotrichum scovillei]|uniref:High-affinity methionine permease n=1 Tax=Colletotrichum scovillei TaxID=1209932 RepID=A0A9P7UB70_9PEZI|nr:high-affinity methionine permease [Colletotrichum scovillei]KAG7068825.1 high-affinity methionine permease [Colletotrichum scovillei]KAG7072781.1 high-affinity methionine permease [Colletotrichum scovillei]
MACGYPLTISFFTLLPSFSDILVASPLGKKGSPEPVVGSANEETRRDSTHMPIPVTAYVAYQKLTSPAYCPPAGGYHGMMRR